MNIKSQAATSIGRKRKGNQDSYLVDPEHHLYLVCDGMGGHRGGEVASALAVQVVGELIAQSADDLDRLADGSPQERSEIYDLLRNAVCQASFSIHQQSEANPEIRGMGTTLTLLLLAGQRGFVAHVGDSRLYLCRNGEVHQVTTDHSLVQELSRAGKLEAEHAKNPRFTNALTRAVGVYPNVAVDLLDLDLAPGDSFLLCSDGLHNYLTPEKLLEGMGQPIDTRGQWFVDFANEAGGKDNITAVVVDVLSVPDERTTARIRLTQDALHQIPLFRHLSYAEMVRIMGVCRAREVEEAEVIIRQGDRGDALYVILEGSVTVWQQGRCLVTLSKGRHFGEMALVDNEPRSATVIAVEKTTLIRILREDFYSVLRQDSVMAVKLLWNFIQTLSHRLRAISAEILPMPVEEQVEGELNPYAPGKPEADEQASDTETDADSATE
ncbi:MAG: Stp1/IreP family PP2C-type Ser/Thr phosphatase [Bradymonadales bacterium]|nr:Stp1/IreP family PP2C-type Ser/Thr phosphatase [Bradymonadales bacterium]